MKGEGEFATRSSSPQGIECCICLVGDFESAKDEVCRKFGVEESQIAFLNGCKTIGPNFGCY